jgi:ectoine hydroxylase-related dioxygenase (phytanoyl-CoA dioxygenase family)
MIGSPRSPGVADIARDRVNEGTKAETLSLAIDQDGFAILPSVLPAQKIQSLLTALEGPENRSRAGVRHLLSNPAVTNVASDPRLLDIAQSVLGNDAFPFKATLFDKSPDANWLITWHQDTALPLRERIHTPGWGPWSMKEGKAYAHAPAKALKQVVALRLHLDDSTDDNGPLRVLPGTHRLGVLSDQEVESVVGQTTPVTCRAERGGIIVMRPLLIHASSKSQSDKSRRVLHIEYATSHSVEAPLQLAIA